MGLPRTARTQRAVEGGLRPLSKSELAKLGYSPGSRRYAPKGVELFTKAGKPRKGARDLTVSRRQTEQQVIGRSFESLAKRRADVTGGRSRMNRYSTLVRQYAAQNGITVGEARRSAELKRIVKELSWKSAAKDPARRHRAERGPKSKKARALVLLGLRDPSWTWDVGDTPEVIPEGDFDVAHYEL